MEIIEKTKKLEISGEYDVAVVGGGIAGISAALAAARNGAKTLLIENQFALGGLATLGLITIYLPLCDGLGNQVSFGIAEELFKLSIKHGWEDEYPEHWLKKKSTKEERAEKRYRVRYNANVFAILCEQLLIDSGVEILYGTKVCSAQVKNKKITSVIIENKSGRSAVIANNFVDCSGDADLCLYAGEKLREFEQGNVLASWYYYHKDSTCSLKILGQSDIPDKNKTEEQKKIVRKRYFGTEATTLSQMTIDSHANLLSNFLKNGEIAPNHNLTQIATIPQIRMTRSLIGEYTIDDTEMHKEFASSVGMFSDWRRNGPIYELPYETLYTNNVKNLFVAGRCISATQDMWDITRVIPVCAVSGQAAGIAAALSKNKRVGIKSLQKVLKKAGVVLHERNLKK